MVTVFELRTRWLASLVVGGIGAAGLLAAVPHSAWAQASAPKAKAPSSGAKAPNAAASKSAAPNKPAPAAKPAPLSPADAAAREEIMHSQPWQDTLHNFNQWLSIQTIYEPAQVEQIKSRLATGIGRMTPAQMQFFMKDMQEKLAVLNSEQGQNAAAYLAQTFAVASPAYARKLRQKLPDVLSMTAAQINQRLLVFASKHQATIDMQKTFEDSRQQQIAYNQAQLAAQLQESDRALDRAQSAAASAGSKGNNFTPARDYFPNAGNDGPFGPGTSIGFWGGGFF